MFDIGWSEMAVILLVALIVIGPRDLPRVARTMGRWVAKGRAMAREFQTALEDMAREAELDKVKSEIEKAGRQIESVGRTNVGKTIEKSIDPTGELSKAFDPTAAGGKPGGPDKPGEGVAKEPPAEAAGPKALSAQGTASNARASKTGRSSTSSSPTKPSPAKKSSSAQSPRVRSPRAKATPTKGSAAKPSDHGERTPAPASRRTKATAPSEPKEPVREPAPAEPG